MRNLNYATSPLLASKTPPWRSRFVVALVGLAFAVLVGRAIYIQIIGTDFYQQQGDKRYGHVIEVPASRGRIVDRNGLVLATSVPVPSIWAIPKDFAADAQQRKALARLLEMKSVELEQQARRQPQLRLAQAPGGRAACGPRSRRWASRACTAWASTAASIPKANRRRTSSASPTSRRRARKASSWPFRSSCRAATARAPCSRTGSAASSRTAASRSIRCNGRDVQLSIDSKVQFFAYQRVRDAVAEHGAKAGSVVVLDVITGEVLALANYPSYDPGDRRKLSGEQLRNRALTDTFEPGSTMKPLVVGWALETKRVKPDTMVNTAPGSLVVGPLVVRDAHPHASLTVEQVIQKSSNVGAARLAMQMPARELWELFSTIGYGQKPQIDFPGTVTGRLKPYKNWRPVEQATMAYGYGLSASLLQMARAYTCLAREGGDVIAVSLLKQDAPAVGVKVYSPATALEIRKMLQMAAGPGGTAPLAQTQGYSVGGKSGTAHKQEGKGYAVNKYRSWFVGMAPISSPRIVVAVMVDEPSKGVYYGGAVAAPVFSQVVQQTLRLLNVPPDIEVTPQIMASKTVPAERESF